MKKSILLFASLFAACTYTISDISASPKYPAGCSVPGTASVTEDSICTGGVTVLMLAGYTGAIQWQSYNGSTWINETGAGSTTDVYSVAPVASTDYRALVTATGCPSDSSNIVTIIVGIPAPSTTGASRCGYGPITLSATGSGTIKWYDQSTGGNLLATGSSYSPNVGTTTTFWAADASNAAGAGVTPLAAQTTVFTGNVRGYWFTSPLNFTITGLHVPLTGTLQNVAVVRFNPAIPPPLYATTTNAFTILFLAQNDPNTGVIPVNIPVYSGDVIGVLGQMDNQNSYSANPQATTINGQTVTLTRMGMQFPLSTTAPQDLWQETGGSIARVEITYEVGCESQRTAAIATVTAAIPVTINASATTLCAGQSATLTAGSTNGAYNYTWSPATGLNTTAGASVIATPSAPITYYVVANDGTCGYIDSVYINVVPASSVGIASVTADTVCAGTSATLILTNAVGSVQWQSYNGSIWVNETGAGNNTPQYIVTPSANMDYRAVATSGVCAPDTSIVLHIEVVTIVDPVTVNDTICGPSGIANLSASGPGVLTWYTAQTGGITVNTGSTFATNISATTTYYVEASAGGTFNVGPPNGGFGSNFTTNSSIDYGLGFDVTQQIILDKVYVYPASNGNITINLRAIQGGTILNSITQAVVANLPINVNLGFVINPGTGYRLELASGSAQLFYNGNGAIYPYTTAACPVTITGYLNPAFTTGVIYYYFYNWQVTEGCKSNRIPVTGVVVPPPTSPTITPNGSQLSSSSATNNQWYVNGSIISGATGQIYNAPWGGSYTVVVTDPLTGCTATSAPYILVGIEEYNGNGFIYLFPNPAGDELTINSQSLFIEKIEIMNLAGQKVYTDSPGLEKEISIITKKFSTGVYIVKLYTDKGITHARIIKN